MKRKPTTSNQALKQQNQLTLWCGSGEGAGGGIVHFSNWGAAAFAVSSGLCATPSRKVRASSRSSSSVLMCSFFFGSLRFLCARTDLRGDRGRGRRERGRGTCEIESLVALVILITSGILCG